MVQNVKPVRKAQSTFDLSRSYADSSVSLDQRMGIPMRDQLRAYSTRVAKTEESPSSPTTRSKRSSDPRAYCKPFCDFLTNNPTVFHAVSAIASDLRSAGFRQLSERNIWKLKKGGRYYIERNGSSLIAFEIGSEYQAGNGVAMLAGHVDALTAKLKPVSKLRSKAGYQQLAVAPYAGALSSTWFDRDLSIGGRVLVREKGKVVTKLVKLDWPIARIATLAPHFGVAASGLSNPETQMVPIIGLDGSSFSSREQEEAGQSNLVSGGERTFASTQPEKLVRAIAKQLGITEHSTIVNWELELFDCQPATILGIEKEFISAGRIDDKLCSWSAVQALLESVGDSASSGIKLVGLFDDEEIGSLLRQGARGNFLPDTISRIVSSFDSSSPQFVSQTYANSFLVSSDVTHAINPSYVEKYLENHSPQLNVGLTIAADSNGHMTTDGVSTAILARCCELGGQKLQVFQIRNDSRSGGTVGPMLSSAMGVRAVDAGMAQLSMHSIRAMTGADDPGLGVFAFRAFLDHYEKVDAEFRDD